MHLARARRDFEVARERVEKQLELVGDPDAFAKYLPLCTAALLVVGNTIQLEAKDHKRPDFPSWWVKTKQDPRYQLMRDLRNAEFKKAQTAHRMAWKGVRSAQGRFVVAGLHPRPGIVVRRRPRSRFGYRFHRSTERSSPGPVTYVIEPPYGNCDLVDFLNEYVAWLRDDLIPTAERLTA